MCIEKNKKIFEGEKNILSTKFGIEIEFTGITRTKAAKVLSKQFGTTVSSLRDYYDTKMVVDSKKRKWKVMSDASIMCEKK